jgi:site-specific DNA-methyltransferase (adenine-specific)
MNLKQNVQQDNEIKNWLNQIICGDCLEVMRGIPDKSVDMILCDLPYGTTACKWDTVIPFEPLWTQYKRLIKPNGAIVLTASQPFTTALIASNMAMFKYCWVWNKKFAGNFVTAKVAPLKTYEDVVVFGSGKVEYYPQMTKRDKPIKSGKRANSRHTSGTDEVTVYQAEPKTYDAKYPTAIIDIPRKVGEKVAHPTQKPVALFEYLIKTYTQPGEIVLDNCIGSGTTAIAALNTGRFFIGIEKEPQYVDIARRRVEQAQAQQSLFGG